MAGKPSEKVAVIATIDPDALTAATHTSDWASAVNYSEMLAIIMVGTLGTSATVNAKLEQATDSSGTGAKDISGTSITALTDAGSDDDKQALINIKASQLDVAGGFNHVRISMTVATATSDGAAVLLGTRSLYPPADQNDLASVDEIVN